MKELKKTALRDNLVVVLLISLLACSSTWALEVLDTGYMVETYASYDYTASSEGLGRANELTFGPEGGLYISHWEEYPNLGHIYRISPDRSVIRWVEGLGTPRRIVWAGGSSYGNYFYVADATPNVVYQIDLSGTVSTFASIGAGPHSVALDRTGAYGGLLYVASRNPDRIYLVRDTGQVQLFSSFPGSVPSGHVDLCFDPGSDYGGHMYATLAQPSGVSSFGGLFSINTNGSATRFAPAIVSATNVEIDPAGQFGGELFVSGKLNHDDPVFTIWRVNSAGAVSEFAVGTIGSQAISSFTFGPDGSMYVAEYSFEEQTAFINRVIPISPLEVAVDIKPGTCPNPLNLSSRGVLSVGVLGTDSFEVSQIDIATVRLAGVAAIRSSFENVSSPVVDGNDCECGETSADGFMDLALKFKADQIVEALINIGGELEKGELWELDLTGQLLDGTPIEGSDCVALVGNVSKALAARKTDINEDGIVNMADFAVMSQFWLEPAY